MLGVKEECLRMNVPSFLGGLEMHERLLERLSEWACVRCTCSHSLPLFLCIRLVPLRRRGGLDSPSLVRA